MSDGPFFTSYATNAAAGEQKPIIISIETAPATKMRYPTAADWQFKLGRVAPYRSPWRGCRNRRYEFLLALHELVEALLCKEAHVSQVADAFAEYEKRRTPGDDSASGDAAGAPYRHEHVIASVIERLATDLLKVDWNRYGAEVASK